MPLRLALAGLELAAIGDFNGRQFTGFSPNQIYVARAARNASKYDPIRFGSVDPSVVFYASVPLRWKGRGANWLLSKILGSMVCILG